MTVYAFMYRASMVCMRDFFPVFFADVCTQPRHFISSNVVVVSRYLSQIRRVYYNGVGLCKKLQTHLDRRGFSIFPSMHNLV